MLRTTNLNLCRIVWISISIFSLSGCSSISGYPERPDSSQLKLETLRNKYFLPAVDVLSVYEALASESQKKSYRNRVTHGRLLALDLQYSLFKEAVYSEGISTNLSLDIAGIITGGAGATVTNTEASQILSALSGGIAGSKTAINQNMYYERTMPAMLALMDAERNKIRVQILKGLIQPVSNYSLGQALSDLERYYDVGSIPGAIASLTETAGEKAKEAADELSFVREASFVDAKAQVNVAEALGLVDSLPSGEAWQLISKPPGAIDPKALNALYARLGVADMNGAQGLLSGAANDAKAKKALKMILALVADRSEKNLSNWIAALKAEQ